MCGTKGIHYVDIAQRCHFLRQGVVVIPLALQKTGVLAQHNLTWLQVQTVNPVGNTRHAAMQSMRVPVGHGREGMFRIELPGFGAAQMRSHQH